VKIFLNEINKILVISLIKNYLLAYTYEYPQISVTVDCIIFKVNDFNVEVLLIQRKNNPFQSQWAFPGGFVDINETIEQAAARELQEETGIKNVKLHQLQTFGDPGRDPRGRTVSIIFFGFTDDDTIKSGDDAKDVAWFSIDHLPSLAFDHNEILKYAIKKLSIKS